MAMLISITTCSISLSGIFTALNREHTGAKATGLSNSLLCTSQHKPALTSSQQTKAAHTHHVCLAAESFLLRRQKHGNKPCLMLCFSAPAALTFPHLHVEANLPQAAELHERTLQPAALRVAGSA